MNIPVTVYGNAYGNEYVIVCGNVCVSACGNEYVIVRGNVCGSVFGSKSVIAYGNEGVSASGNYKRIRRMLYGELFTSACIWGRHATGTVKKVYV
jgi:hypothetical protein